MWRTLSTGCVLLVTLFLLRPAHADVEVLKSPVEIEARFPHEVDYEVELNADWSAVRELRVSITLPDDVPRGTTLVCYLKDVQWDWYQHEPGGSLKSGKTNQVRIDMTPGAQRWFARGHSRQWDGYVAHKIRGFGVKIFQSAEWHGKIRIDRIYGRTLDKPTEVLAVTDLRTNGPAVGLFEKFEISFDLTRTYENPFDPDQVDVRAIFTSPSGKTSEQFGFHYREFVRRKSPLGDERLTPVGKSYWKVRWTPSEVGKWKAELLLWDHHQEKQWKAAVAEAEARAKETGKKGVPKPASSGLGAPELPAKEDYVVRVRPIDFECTSSKGRPDPDTSRLGSASHGFLRVDARDPFYFSYQDGTFFYPIGQMLRSPVDLRLPFPGYQGELREGEGTYAFDRMMKRLSENGVNFIRVWMSIWWVGLEAPMDYGPGYEGLGRYNMSNAWKLDHILEEAHRLGLAVKLNLNNHGQLSRHVDQEFYESCYNVMHGGMLRSPQEFWTNREAKKYMKRRFRYIVARWAYSPEILGWELWNEVDLTEDFEADTVAEWHREFARYLKGIDPWKHLISTHFYSDDQSAAVYGLPEVQFIPGDLYQGNVVSAMRNIWLTKKNFGKPTFISEYGVGHNADQMETNFHGGLWSSTVVPMAGTAMFWWWNFVDEKDLYFHYKPVALFNAGEDRRGKDWKLTSAVVRRGAELHGELQVLGRQNPTEAHLWVYDALIFSQNDGERYRHPPSFVGSTLEVPGLEPGKYRVEFWNTYSGKVTGIREVDHRSGDFRVPLATVQADLAVKIKKMGK